MSMLDSFNIRIAIVPANCTNRLQPPDVSINKSAKEFLRRQFHQWYSDQVCHQMQREAGNTSIDLSLSVVKPLGAKWLTALYKYMKDNPTISIIIINIFFIFLIFTFFISQKSTRLEN